MVLFRKRSDKTNYTTAKRVLSKEEYKEYKELKAEKPREKYRREIKELRYAKTVPGRIESGFGTVAKGFVEQRKTQLRFARDVPRKIIGTGYPSRYSQIRISGRGRVGRPKGSYDPRYAAYGGVYEYRKRLNAQLRQQRLEFLRRQQMTPQQQALLSREEARQREAQMSPENKVIPDTAGTVRTKSFQDEIDEAANLVP